MHATERILRSLFFYRLGYCVMCILYCVKIRQRNVIKPTKNDC